MLRLKSRQFWPRVNSLIKRVQVTQLESWGYMVLPTVEKTLVCGDKGLGAMAHVDTIVSEVKSQLERKPKKNI